MALSDLLDKEFNRVRIVFLAMLASLVFLGTVLWRVQVVNARAYRSSLDRQSVRRVRLPAARGIICDRNGVALADNRPSYCIALFIEELRRPGKWDNTIDEVDGVITSLEEVLDIERQVTRDEIRKHISKRLPLPFLAWRDIDNKSFARWAESGANIPGVDIYVEPVRTYPNGPSAAHALGRVCRAAPEQDEEEPYHFYLPEMEGANGIEAVMNNRLAGTPGGELLRVDASGFKHEKIGERPAEPGRNVWLTVDIRIQRLADAVLDGETGAIVVLDPRNGEVLAMASAPAFDPNVFVPSITSAEWQQLEANENHPLFNRAVLGCYPPGSIFKPLVAITALESGKATANTTFNCPGYFDLGGARFRCWSRRGHGRISMQKAIEQSCNAYFCQLGLKCGHERISRMAEALGLGVRTGIELPFESAGLVPDNAWKSRTYNDGWRPGDTCNLSIGQGALTVTPLQMAMFTAAIANGGYVYKPTLILRKGGRSRSPSKKMAWSARNLKVVRDGMYDVVQAEKGTGKRARISEFTMGGKTGSAEYGPREKRKKYAWMIVFGPFDNPRYALAIVIEDAVAGGVTAAPRVKELMEGICLLEKEGHRYAVAKAGTSDRRLSGERVE